MKRIAILLEGRVQYERNVLRGIRDYASEKTDWLLRLSMPGRRTAAFLRDWQPDGILYQSADLSPALLRELSGNRAALHLSESPPRRDLPGVGLDNAAVGRAAARYFLERRYRHFAYVSASRSGFSRNRGRSFRTELRKAGFATEILELGGAGKRASAKSPNEDRLRLTDAQVTRWLRDRPRPLALFATHDECSLHLSTLCRAGDIRVPEDIALLGVDDDTLVCEIAWPRLSSIAVPSRRVGHEAAGRLDRILQGGENTPRSLLLPPAGVVSRQSTNVHQTEDELVNRALRVIAERLAHGVNVEEVLREVGASRRLLERRFARQLGRTPHREIQRRRVAEAKRLLLDTRLPLHEIAARCGCRDASSLVTIFRRECGRTPGEFRKVGRG